MSLRRPEYGVRRRIITKCSNQHEVQASCKTSLVQSTDFCHCKKAGPSTGGRMEEMATSGRAGSGRCSPGGTGSAVGARALDLGSA